ncbi:MAG: sulfotransferase domain-containing protein [Azonexus sp.]
MATEQNVLVGKDGWLFLDGGNNPFLDYLRGYKVFSPKVVEAWRRLLESRRAYFDKKNIRYLHVFAPEKASVYPEHVDQYPECVDHPIDVARGFIGVLSGSCPNLFLNVLPYFNNLKAQAQLYYKTDTHWNFSGCYACYQLICSALNVEPNRDLVDADTINANALLDLGMMHKPEIREKIKVRKFQKQAKRVYENVLIAYKEKNKLENEAGLHVGSHAIFRNESAKQKCTLVIFGDSFSEYRPTLLTAMLAEEFSEVHFIWSANIDFGYVERVDADIVITELCERFAGTVPSDEFDVETFARQRIENYESKSRAHGFMATPADSYKVRPRLPDYLIIGSMKCGTTILNDFICKHPDVVPAKQKEIHYFSMHYDRGIDWYGDFFREAPADKLVGDASPTYMAMSNNVVLPNLINSILPSAKIIAILKNPVHRAISHFFHLRDINKVESFQNLDPNEIFSGDLAAKYFGEFSCNQALWPMKYVLDFGNYCSQLFSYRRVFGDRLLILKNEDLWLCGQEVMNKVFPHLDIERIDSSYFETKAYVTIEKRKVVFDDAYSALSTFYKSEFELLNKHFGIVFD